MSLPTLLITALLIAPLAALAQDKPAADPADAAAPAAAVVYESAFATYRPFASSEQTPDKGWRAANRLVGELGGHAGNLAPAADEAAATPAPTTTPKAAAPAGKHQHMH